ncbi:MAG: HypC/HybG/HupF family hydrogenase formation chaperone [Acidobacteria bacterium]|nr:HypC/HybG/HupF family hydrogenase formation chaperone [Acidobacteriota bacterium]
MCLAVPMKLVKMENSVGLVELSGIEREVSLDLVPEAKIGDYLLIHAGFAISVIDEKEANETLDTIREYLSFGEEIGNH